MQAFQSHYTLTLTTSLNAQTRAQLHHVYVMTDDDALRASLLKQITELTALVNSLTMQLSALLGRPITTQDAHTFQRPLNVGDDNQDVLALQKKLNQLGFKVSDAGAGSPGNETTYFGPRTTAAIKRFQCHHGIICVGSPSTTGFGNFGPRTRAKVNGL